MGHTFLETIGAKKKFRRVTDLISTGANAAAVAAATDEAADKALNIVKDDNGFKDAVHYLVQLGIAASQKDPAKSLAQIGVNIPDNPTVVDVVAALSDALDERSKVFRHSSDFGPMAQQAATSALAAHLGAKTESLFDPSPQDVMTALKTLSSPAEFGRFARDFFGRLTHNYLGYFVEKTLGSQVGAGHQFTTVNQMVQFQDALRNHCHSTAAVVQKFSEEWFSKHRFEGKGDITKKESDDFGWYALTEKTRAALKAWSGDYAT